MLKNCKFCHKDFDGYYNRLFCSKSCSLLSRVKTFICSECGEEFQRLPIGPRDLKRKNGLFFCSRNCNTKSVGRSLRKPKYINKTCEYCKKQYNCPAKKSVSSVRRFCNLTCRANAVAEEHPDWTVFGKNRKPSFPEIYFARLLDEKNINYTAELRIGRFFIDFALEDDKLALEIDGKQHLQKEHQERDKRKDAFLISKGWKVFRIPWVSLKYENEMKKMLDEFLMMRGKNE